MYKHRNRLLTASALGVSLALSGCGLIGGDESATGITTTSIKGKVTLAGVVGDTAAKPFGNAPYGKPGSVLYKQSLNHVGGSAGWPSLHAKTAFANAEVFLYDADHPEWTGPVANTTTDATGAYTLDKMSGAVDNDNAYADGATIPKGHYTLIASDYDPTTGQVVVAIQNIAQDFEGSVTGNDLEAVPSDVSPNVVSVVGQEKNTDGTETYGSADVGLAPNGHVQVAFNMPMARETVTSGITITPAVDGTWEVSPDWMTATFYPTTALVASTPYTVTIKGDDTYKSAAVKNVYGNRLEATATGTFTTLAAADTTAPTLTFAPSGTGIDAGAVMTITSNELLDVSRLTLNVTPKLGSKPLVNYTKDGSSYVYELVTSSTLTPGSIYTGNISGIKDLAGVSASDISINFTVASTVDGVTALSADADVASVQTAAADLFKKWVAAMNEHNLTKWQGLTAGQFAMDYNLANGFDGMDINRDGAYSLDEFSGMLKFAFNMWDSCGTTLVGEIVDDPAVADDGISVDAANGIADFAFKLTGTSTVGGQDCAEATPKDTMYATVRKISGVWKVEHASEGIDTRDTVAGQLTGIKLVGPAEDSRIGDGTGKAPAFSKDAMNDNGTPNDATDDTLFATAGTPLKLEWNEVADATAYVFIVMDANNPDVGMAMVLPADKTVLDFGDPAMNNGSLGAEVGEDFGFHGEFHPTPGSPLLWQIAALGSATVENVKSGRTGSLAKDLIAVSKLRRILLEGVPTKMKIKVEAGNPATEVKYNEMYQGFKLDGITGNDGKVTLTVTTEMMENIAGTAAMPGVSDNQGMVRFEGVFRGQHQLDFDPDTNTSVVAGTVVRKDLDGLDVTLHTYTIVLSNLPPLGIGWNRFEVMDHVTPNTSCPDCGGGDGLNRQFQVHTDVGVAPIIAVDKTTGVKDDTTGTPTLVGDDWNFFKATTGAKSVTIAGTVRTEFATQGDLNVNLWNDELQVNNHVSVKVGTNGTFTLTMDIYHGRNWINIDGDVCHKVQTSNCPHVSTNLGIETDTGATYVPPIKIVSVALASDTTKTLAAMESFGNFSRYDASTLVTATDATIIISGHMESAVDAADKTRHPNYGAGGEGGWQGGDLTVDSAGNFTITLDLFKGFNHVNVSDVANNWMGMEIYTSVGKPVVKPTITTVNDVAYTAPARGGMGMASVTACSATIKGTAKQGDVRVMWRGEVANITGYNDFYNEEQTVTTTGTGALNADGATVYGFTVTVPVISGKNFVDINDSTWNWSGVELSTTDTTCTYTAPTMGLLTPAGVFASDGITALTQSMPGDPFSPYDAGSNTTITVKGTSNRPGRSVTVEMMACGSRDEYSAYAGTDGSWTVSGIKVYDGQWNVRVPTGMMGNDINFNVTSAHSPQVLPVPPIAVSAVSAVDSAGNAVGDTITADAGNGCGNGNFSSAGSVSVSYVKVVGTSASKSAKHSYFAGDTTGEFTSDANGAFSFVAPVFGGFNNIWINDQNWNGFGLNVNVASGPARPQYVAITAVGVTSVTAGATELAGVAATAAGSTVTITGTISTPTGSTAFSPNNVSANVNGTNYSSDPNMGGSSMKFVDNGNGTYSFEFDITVDQADPSCTSACAGAETWMWVNANGFGPGHGISFVLNPSGSWSKGFYWKPGKAAPKAKDMTHVLQSIVEDKSKYWNMQ